MRKIIFGINTTLDGCCDHTKGVGSEDVHNYFAELLRGADTLVYGRKTYELMVPFWPDMARNHTGPSDHTVDFAKAFDAVREIILFSRTMEKADDSRTRIVRSDLREEMEKLKREEGKDIMVGGVDLPSQLMELDLIDEYHFVVQPLLAGDGRRLMEGMKWTQSRPLQLLGSKEFESGNVALRYGRGR